MKRAQKCPHCGSDSIFRSRRGLFERLLFGLRPFRCGTCLRRFHLFVSSKDARGRGSWYSRPTYVTEHAEGKPVAVRVVPEPEPAPVPAPTVVRRAPMPATSSRRLVPWYLIRR